jgi:hypothetical protein
VAQIGDAMKEEKQEIKTDDAVDWTLLSSVLKAERASMIESVGEAIGVHGNQLLDEVEAMIDEKVAKVRDELASMLTAQVAMMLRQHAELRAEADVRMAALRKDLLGSDDSGVVQLPNPLRGRKAAAWEVMLAVTQWKRWWLASAVMPLSLSSNDKRWQQRQSPAIDRMNYVLLLMLTHQQTGSANRDRERDLCCHR